MLRQDIFALTVSAEYLTCNHTKIPHSTRDFLIYRNMNKFLNRFVESVCDVALVVGAAVGVGLLSGKETQVFVGVLPNALIFAVVFFAVLSIFREFCRKNAVSDTTELAVACFGRYALVFTVALCLCAFVCVVTCLAGVEQCLSDILYLSKLPLYAVLIASVGALVMTKGLSALKICNVVSLIMAAALFAALAVNNVPSDVTSAPKPYMPIAYALFNFTMSLCLTCRLGARSSKRQNIFRSVVSALILAALLIASALLADFSKPLPTLSNISDPILKGFAVITIALTSMCGIVGCALPVTELLDSVIGDRTVSSMCVFLCACAFSMFGFDFLVRFGYIFVALIGAVISITVLLRRQKSSLVRAK